MLCCGCCIINCLSLYASMQHHKGDNLLNLFGPNVIWISVAAARLDAQLNFFRILPTATATMKMVDKSQINETH
jgi:hypothetical protein